MPDIPTSVPASFRAGDKIQWKITDTNYPASVWTLNYFLVQESRQITLTATAEGDDHVITIAPADSKTYPPGIYSYVARMENGVVEIYSIDTGKIEILPDFAAATTGYDDRAHVKKVLDALEAVILGKASKDQLSYSIAGRSISRLSPSEIIEWRNTYRAEYLRLEREAGRGRPSQIHVRF